MIRPACLSLLAVLSLSACQKSEERAAEDLISWSRGGSTSYVQDPTARGVRYEVDQTGKVSAIHAGDPSIQLVEGCS